jgi:hypothetical protein
MTLLKIRVLWDVALSGWYRYLLIFGRVLKPVASHSQNFKIIVLLGPKKTLGYV